jgi:hypothetical protein
MDGDGWHDPVFVKGHDYGEGEMPPLRLFKFVSPGFRETMRMPLIAGRDITWDDTYKKLPVALISENVAREMWKDPASA